MDASNEYMPEWLKIGACGSSGQDREDCTDCYLYLYSVDCRDAANNHEGGYSSEQ